MEGGGRRVVVCGGQSSKRAGVSPALTKLSLSLPRFSRYA